MRVVELSFFKTKAHGRSKEARNQWRKEMGIFYSESRKRKVDATKKGELIIERSWKLSSNGINQITGKFLHFSLFCDLIRLDEEKCFGSWV